MILAVFRNLKQKVKITIVNCVKRHHTRLFPQSERGDKLGVGQIFQSRSIFTEFLERTTRNHC